MNTQSAKKLFEYCKEGWPDSIQKFPSSLSPYWSSRGEISKGQKLLLKGPRLTIPSSIRLEILDRIHDGRQRIVKCSRPAKESVWWPDLGKQLEEMVTNCHKCIEHRKPNRESMITSAVPERQWQVLGTDLFTTRLKGIRRALKGFLLHICDVKPKAATSQ